MGRERAVSHLHELGRHLAQQSSQSSQNKSFDRVFESQNLEVDEQIDPHTGKPQLRERLCLVNGFELPCGLQLHHCLAFHDQLLPVSRVELVTLVLCRQLPRR